MPIISGSIINNDVIRMEIKVDADSVDMDRLVSVKKVRTNRHFLIS